MFVGRKIDMPAAGKHWRDYHRQLEGRVRSRRIGSAVPLIRYALEYLSNSELHNAMNERFEHIAVKPDQKLRNKTARDFITDINGIISDFREQQERTALARELAEDANLRERALDPDNPKWLGELTLAVINGDVEIPLSRVPKLWVPTSFRVGVQEGVGPNGIGIALQDEDLMYVRARRSLVIKVCSSLNLNPIHFTASDEPLVLMVDTSPLPAAGIENFNLPPMHYNLPLQEPRGYVI